MRTFVTTANNFYFVIEGMALNTSMLDEGSVIHESIDEMYQNQCVVYNLHIDEVVGGEWSVRKYEEQLVACDTRGIPSPIEEDSVEEFLNNFFA